MRPRTSLGLGLQKLPPRTDAGRQAVRDLAEHDAKRHGKVTQMVDYSELELRTLAEMGMTAEDFLR